MSTNPIKEIKELVVYLPEKDRPLANKFIEERNFEYLLEIVYSDLIKAENKSSLCTTKEEFNQLHIPHLEELHSQISEYMNLIYDGLNNEESEEDSFYVDVETLVSPEEEED